MKKRKVVKYRGFEKAKQMHMYWCKQRRRPGLMVSGGGGWWRFKITEK